jgi:hypothetical protein
VANAKSAHAAPAASAATKPVEPEQKKPCFVISPIGPDNSETRKKADQVLRHIIKKALSDTYAVERADDISKPGLITLQVIERLMKDPMVVADLTDANANVYYELAIRHFVKKPVVHLIAEGQEPPFDVAQMRYVQYDLTDPDSVERAAQEVRNQVANSEKGEATLTPIQFVEMLDTARDEGKNQFVSLALGIQSALSNLQADVRQVGTQVGYLVNATALEYPIPISAMSGTQPRSGVTVTLSPSAFAALQGQRGLSAVRWAEELISASRKSAPPTKEHPAPAEPPEPRPDAPPQDKASEPATSPHRPLPPRKG